MSEREILVVGLLVGEGGRGGEGGGGSRNDEGDGGKDGRRSEMQAWHM